MSFRISRTRSAVMSILAPYLLIGGVSPVLLNKLAIDTIQLVDDLRHMHGYADGAGLVRYGSADRLSNPPGGVGAELEALAVVELLHATHQTDIALLNEVR